MAFIKILLTWKSKFLYNSLTARPIWFILKFKKMDEGMLHTLAETEQNRSSGSKVIEEFRLTLTLTLALTLNGWMNRMTLDEPDDPN